MVLSARGRPVVMGVVNVTPDSFSDGGRYADTGGRDRARARAAGRRGRRTRHRRRVHAPGRDPAAGLRGARPGGPGDHGTRRGRRGGVRGHDARRGRRGGDRGRSGRGQRRLRRARRPAHPRRGGGLRHDVRRHALARPQRPDAGPRRLRRAGWRGGGRASRAAASGSTRCSPPGSRRTGSSSTRGWASPSGREHNWALLRGFAELHGARLPAAGRREPQVVPGRPAGRPRTAPPAGRPSGRRRGTRSRCCWPSRASGGSGCTTSGALVMCCGCWRAMEGQQ